MSDPFVPGLRIATIFHHFHRASRGHSRLAANRNRAKSADRPMRPHHTLPAHPISTLSTLRFPTHSIMFSQVIPSASRASRLCLRCSKPSQMPISITRRFLSTPAPSSEPAATASSSKDPDHPYLYYHTLPTPAPGRIALSFLPHPPTATRSKTVLGYLPFGAAGLGDLEENRDFL